MIPLFGILALLFLALATFIEQVQKSLKPAVNMYLEESSTSDMEFVLPFLSHHVDVHGNEKEEGKKDVSLHDLLHELDTVQEEALETWLQACMGNKGSFSPQKLNHVYLHLSSRVNGLTLLFMDDMLSSTHQISSMRMP